MTIETVATYYFHLSNHPDFNDKLMAALAPLQAQGKTDGISVMIPLDNSTIVGPAGDPIGYEIHRTWDSQESAEEWVAVWTQIRDEYIAGDNDIEMLPFSAIEIQTT